jgi:cellobiose-specific phosphotransferase system component IIA
MSKIDEQLSEDIVKLSEEVKIARGFGGDIARASTYLQEIERARSGGDAEAAYVYVDKVRSELLPITGRYNESKKKYAMVKDLIANAEFFIVDTKEARSLMVDASKALDMRDFDKLDMQVKAAQDRLYKAIPPRMNEEMRKAKDDLLEAKMKNVNITPLITVLKSATNLMKAGDYAHALKEMRDFRELIKKTA